MGGWLGVYCNGLGQVFEEHCLRSFIKLGPERGEEASN